MATVIVAFIPVVVFIYNYGGSITRSNLYDQLDVSMNDIRIRFEDTIGDYARMIEDFTSSPVLMESASDGVFVSDEIESEAAYCFGSSLGELVVTIALPDGTLVWSSEGWIPEDVSLSDRIPQMPCEEILYTTSFRYESRMRDEVVINMTKEVRDGDGKTVFYVFADIIGAQFIRYADPALVNEVCLLDESTGMVSSLIHLDDYRPLEDGWVFSDTLESRNGNVLITSKPVESLGFVLIGYLDISPYMDSLNSFYGLSFVVLCAGFFAALLLAGLFASTLVRPISHLIQAMDSVERGNLETRAPESSISEMENLNTKFNEMISQLSALMERIEDEAQKLRDAERKALEAQMNPHFLFNTLNAISSLARIHHEKEIEDIAVKLGRLLRYAVNNKESTETLEKSWLLMESYLGIQQIRFKDRLHACCHIDDAARSVVTPKLIIQPLVENAISNGLEPKVGLWELSVSITLDEDCDTVSVKVCDNGVGFDVTPYRDMDSLADSTHTGMYNVYRRLKLYYGNEATFSVQSETGRGTTVHLSFPAHKGDEEQ